MGVVTSETFINLSTSFTLYPFPFFPFTLFPVSLFPRCLKRLREPEVHLRSLQAIDCRGTGEIIGCTGRATLWNQKLRRIEQVPIINRQGAAEWRLNSEAQA